MLEAMSCILEKHLLFSSLVVTKHYSLRLSGAFASPDIFDRGHMLWPRAIGLDSCFLGLTFLKEVAMAKCIIDPFCGVGVWGMGL